MTTYVLVDGELVIKRDSMERRLQIVRDIPAYKSMIDGKMIDGRSQHRTHLRDNNCIEVGNETQESKPPVVNNDARKRALYRQFENMSARQISQVAAELRQIGNRG